MSTQTEVEIVTEVLGVPMFKKIWSASYFEALPVAIQHFDLFAVLPAMFYMFRFGHRRGRGKFFKTFGTRAGTIKERRESVTIEKIAAALAQSPGLDGFQSATEQAILGDLLLSFCLENRNRSLGRQEQIQRVAPTHYMASWIDLPEESVNLRYVPEMIVAMLVNQKGQYVQQTKENEPTWFAVGHGFANNLLLQAFHQGIVHDGLLGDRASDRFDEATPIGLDQLLMVRLAQCLGEAPAKLLDREPGKTGETSENARGSQISNKRPIAERAASEFSDDIRRFVRSYSTVIPRHAFVELLESCMAVGLTVVVTSVFELLFEWHATGEICEPRQQPAQFFVDCSNGVKRPLYLLAEQSMDDFMRRCEHIPVVLMALRLLDYQTALDKNLQKQANKSSPYARDWLNLLGDLLHDRQPDGKQLRYFLETKANELANALRDDYPQAAALLDNEETQPNPILRLAEALTLLQKRVNTHENLKKLIDSVLLIAQPNGLARKRTVTRQGVAGAGARRREVRSLVLSDSVLDYLVHLHLLRPGYKPGQRPLSLKEFLQILRERYGFCVDTAPEGMTVSNEDLQLNRRMLERRLRDLGLLLGVNDAESMKRLTPRFLPFKEAADDALD
jgi:hypothetical protein